MAKKEFMYKGKTLEELKKLSDKEIIELLPARQRRKLKKGLTDGQKNLLKKIERKDAVKTHSRDMIVLPKMIGRTVRVHNGKEFQPVLVLPEMIGHYLGEFVLTRKRTTHSAPGVGATKSSSNISVK